MDSLAELFQEAEALEKLEKNNEAFDKYTSFIEKAIDLLPSLPEDGDEAKEMKKKVALAYNNRGFIRYNKVEFAQAVDDYTKSIAMDPSHAFTFYNRGLIHYRLCRFPLAIKDMKKALDLDPSFESASKCLEESQINLDRRETKA